MNMMEKVVRAIIPQMDCAHRNEAFRDKICTPDYWQGCGCAQDAARAAIAAMREPTEGMLEVLAWNGASSGTWQDCIDEILQEDKP